MHLGHACLSHLFDDLIQDLPETEKPVREMRHHEDRGVLLFPHLCHEYKITELTEDDLEAIGALVKGEVMPGQPAFLFEILANHHSQYDSDKFCYLHQDSIASGMPHRLLTQFDRHLRHIRINPNRHLIFGAKIAQSVVDLFAVRKKMHYHVYQHHTAIKLKLMFLEILKDMYRVFDWRKLLNEYASNNHAWRTDLTDGVFYLLQSSYVPKQGLERCLLIGKKFKSGTCYGGPQSKGVKQSQKRQEHYRDLFLCCPSRAHD